MTDEELFMRAKVWVAKWMKPADRDLPSGEPVADTSRENLTKALFKAFKEIGASPEARIGSAAIQLVEAVREASQQRAGSDEDHEY